MFLLRNNVHDQCNESDKICQYNFKERTNHWKKMKRNCRNVFCLLLLLVLVFVSVTLLRIKQKGRIKFSNFSALQTHYSPPKFIMKSRAKTRVLLKNAKRDLMLWENVHVITRNQSAWKVMDNSTCTRKKNFILGYTTNRNDIPIYLHPPDDDIHISRVLLNGGSWENDLVNKIVNVMREFPEAMFIDIGAHVGVYSLTVAYNGFKVLAIDCYMDNIERLCASALEGRTLSTRISIIYNALSNTGAKLVIKQASPSNIGSNKVVSVADESNIDDPRNIQAIQLDDLLEIFQMKSAVIKMDVEGHEHNVLKGGEDFFKQVDVKFVLMEFNFHKNRESGKFIQDFMQRHKMHPDLPDDLSQTNQSLWPWNVQWVQTI